MGSSPCWNPTGWALNEKRKHLVILADVKHGGAGKILLVQSLVYPPLMIPDPSPWAKPTA